ncbi:MAG: TIGR04255 family protein [Candidatus Methanoplasma sp.]|jgi:uncharacterized protein (TIGR04255 family)|nr:TIGR04255 family protein [Candidatus Methanoplasma sp.]
MTEKHKKYRKPPVEEVFCRVDFPPILRISKELPAEFQEKIRTDYPNYSKNVGQEAFVSGAGDKQVSPAVSATYLNTYTFQTEGNNGLITIAPNFLFFSAKSYVDWDDFKQKFNKIFKLFEETYSPQYYSRAGLRYCDVFVRSKYGLTDKRWADLINPEFLGHLSNERVEDDRFNSACDVKFKDGDERARITAGIALDDNN